MGDKKKSPYEELGWGAVGWKDIYNETTIFSPITKLKELQKIRLPVEGNKETVSIKSVYSWGNIWIIQFVYNDINTTRDYTKVLIVKNDKLQFINNAVIYSTPRGGKIILRQGNAFRYFILNLITLDLKEYEGDNRPFLDYNGNIVTYDKDNNMLISQNMKLNLSIEPLTDLEDIIITKDYLFYRSGEGTYVIYDFKKEGYFTTEYYETVVLRGRNSIYVTSVDSQTGYKFIDLEEGHVYNYVISDNKKYVYEKSRGGINIYNKYRSGKEEETKHYFLPFPDTIKSNNNYINDIGTQMISIEIYPFTIEINIYVPDPIY